MKSTEQLPPLISSPQAIDLVEEYINRGEDLLQLKINDQVQLEAAWELLWEWMNNVSNLLRRYSITGFYRPRNVAGLGIPSVRAVSFSERAEEFFHETQAALDQLKTILTELKPLADTKEGSLASKRVFLVHGHDVEAKLSVARYIEKLGFKLVILDEQPNRTRAIIEKFETYADVGFAVVLLTPDDVGSKKGDIENLRPRARQNVILELGFFLGRLGRDRVCALHKGNLELPSDISGVLWIELDAHQTWQLALGREMKAAGLDIDLNRLS